MLAAVVGGCGEQPSRLLRESVDIWRELGDRHWLAIALREAAERRGDPTECRRQASESRALYDALGDRWGVADATILLGQITYDAGAVSEARALSERSLAVFRELADSRGIGSCLEQLGAMALDEGEYDRASALLEAGLAAHREAGGRIFQTHALNRLGLIAVHLGDEARADAYLAESMAIYADLGRQANIAAVLAKRALATLEKQEPVRAAGYLTTALTICRDTMGSNQVGGVLQAVAALAAAAGDLARAARLFGAAAGVVQASGADLVKEGYRSLYERTIAPVEKLVGGEALATPWTEGTQLSLIAAVNEALAYTEAVAAMAPPTGVAGPAIVTANAPVAAPGSAHLSAREVGVLRLIAAGKSNREIAATLFISVNTVIRHVAHIFAKTGCANRAEAVAYAMRHGLAD
jgi:non-specific serine/threonine protein kinase